MFQISEKIIQFPLVNSTNNYIAKLYREGEIPLGTAIMADFQTAGKGQRGSEWLSKPGENLLFSMILPSFGISMDQHFTFSSWAALGVCSVIQMLLPEKSVAIKWPNDILVDGKKIAGILIETTVAGPNLKTVIIGLGLNVNERELDCLPKATSLFREIGTELSPKGIAEQLLSQWNSTLSMLEFQQVQQIQSRYFQVLWNKEPRLGRDKSSNVVEEFQIIQVADNGKALIRSQSGKEKWFDFKEIEWA